MGFFIAYSPIATLSVDAAQWVPSIASRGLGTALRFQPPRRLTVAEQCTGDLCDCKHADAHRLGFRSGSAHWHGLHLLGIRLPTP